MIPNSVVSIGVYAFAGCPSLTSVYSQGNASSFSTLYVYTSDSNVTTYFLYGASGWGPIMDGFPTAIWTQQLTLMANPSQVGTVSGGGTCAVSTNVQISATASNGWAFTGWNDGSKQSSRTIIMPTTNVTYTANFMFQCNYTTNSDSTINLTAYTGGTGGALILPNTINGLPVTCIGSAAFSNFTNVTSVTIPASVTNIGDSAFSGCANLVGVYFLGNAPSVGGTNVFTGDSNAIVYYLAGTTGWGSTFDGCPTTLSLPTGFNGWNNRMLLSFSGYNRPETLTNFPALVMLGTNIDGFSYNQFASANGYDLRFASLTGSTALNYEIEQWNTNGNSYVWVQVPQLSSGSYIWAYWGNTNASIASSPATYATNGATWDSSAFAGVWHMTQPNTMDSTVNRNNGTATGSVSNAIGIIGGGQSVAGGYETVADSASLDFTPAATISGWVRFNTLPSGNGNEQAITRKSGQWALEAIVDGSTLEMRNLLHTSGTSGWTAGNDDVFNPSLVAGNWYYFAFTYNGAQLCNFENGRLIGTHVVSGTISQGGALGLGASAGGSGDSAGQCALANAIMDEVRVEKVFRSTNWIWAAYLNVVSNSTFIAYGSAQSGGGNSNQPAPCIPSSTWIQQYFPGTPTNDYTSLASSVASNGMTVWQDYLAGMNPTNQSGCFAVIITNAAGQIVVSVPSVQTNACYAGVNRYYEIDECTNLTDGSWQPAPGYAGLPANDGIIACTNAAQNSTTFYRAKVLLQ
jgi:hypothetical protein